MRGARTSRYRCPEAAVLLAEEFGRLHRHPVEDQAADRVRADHFEVLAAQAGPAGGTTNALTPRAPAPSVVRAKTV